MINKTFKDIVLSDFDALIENGITENRTIEYKEILEIKGDGEKKELLADISSFANSMGGDLVFGIQATKGIPLRLCGMVLINPDDVILQLESLIRDGISPRLSNVEINTFKVETDSYIVIIRIPKGWNIPHQVVFKGTDKFYSRGTNGKYKMDIDELRSAFTQASSVEKEIEKFVANRRNDIVSDVMPVSFDKTAKIVIHLVPFSSMALGKRYDLSSIEPNIRRLREINGSSTTPRFDLHGWLTSSLSPGPTRNNYMRLYHNGIIEAVNGELFFPYGGYLRIPVEKTVNYELFIVEAINNYLQFYHAEKIELPIALYISYIGVKDYYLSCGTVKDSLGNVIKLAQYSIHMPAIKINHYNEDIPAAVKFAFDMIWNGCGYKGSINYTPSGKWSPIGKI
jgi:hypothetical protein